MHDTPPITVQWEPAARALLGPSLIDRISNTLRKIGSRQRIYLSSYHTYHGTGHGRVPAHWYVCRGNLNLDTVAENQQHRVLCCFQRTVDQSLATGGRTCKHKPQRLENVIL